MFWILQYAADGPEEPPLRARALPHCLAIVAHARTVPTIPKAGRLRGEQAMPKVLSARAARAAAMARRQFLGSLAGAAALPFLGKHATAQDYPARPVRVLVGQAAGSSSDIIARLIAHRLSERLPPPVRGPEPPRPGRHTPT